MTTVLKSTSLIYVLKESIANSYYAMRPLFHQNLGFSDFVESCDNLTLLHVLKETFSTLEDVNLLDFHFRIIPAKSSKKVAVKVNDEGFLFEFFAGDNLQGPNDSGKVCIGCSGVEKSNPYFLYQRSNFNFWLDAKNRPMIIITPIKHLHRITDMDDADIVDFFRATASLLKRVGDGKEALYTRIVVNHGTYRNVEHLHLKLEMRRDWKNCVEKIKHGEL